MFDSYREHWEYEEGAHYDYIKERYAGELDGLDDYDDEEVPTTVEGTYVEAVASKIQCLDYYFPENKVPF